MLDSLVALRLELANASKVDNELSSIGRGKIQEVHAVLDNAIYGVKRVIGDIDRPQRRKSSA